QTVSLSHNGTFDVLNGVTASDKEDGDLTKAIKVTGNVDLSKEGTYTLTYSVTDSAGQTTSAKRVITVANDLPVISADDQTIEVGTSFDPVVNVTASDVQDGDLTKDVNVTGNVDTTKLGTSQLTYSVSDHDGGQTTKTINITVYAKDASFSGLDALTVQQGSTPDLRKGVSVSDPYSATPSDFTVTTCDTKTPGQKSVT
ncbi:immunoglobulin-like domain-containing protein, partial [Lacticaseibacillus paracasei]|uniref:immunoglobulin-like domain-containing protein n=1 Tax=Lacticaseibacillus paracasei TaxID=1597 RepID=UPI000FFBF45C